jgi:hypothetical protein
MTVPSVESLIASPHRQEKQMNVINRTLDIEHLSIRNWDDIIGNFDLKDYCKEFLWQVRCEGRRTGFNSLLSGSSRSGKNGCVEYAMKCLGCFDFNFDTLEACGKCPSCTMEQYKCGNRGWENWCWTYPPEEVPTPIEYFYAPVDCSYIDQDGLTAITNDIRQNQGILNVIFLDEVHRLCSRNMDEKLLKPMDDYEAIWIATSAYADRHDGSSRRPLEKMLQNRFTYRIKTQKPNETDQIIWTANVCERIGISVEDPRSTIALLTERCNCIPGMALQVLSKAYNTRDKTLTKKLLNQHVFDFDDGVVCDESTDGQTDGSSVHE